MCTMRRASPFTHCYARLHIHFLATPIYTVLYIHHTLLYLTTYTLHMLYPNI